MARGPSQRELYALLEARYGRTVADAYLEAVADLQRAAEVRRAVDAIANHDFDALLDALHLDRGAYDPMLDQISAAYGDGGRGAATYMPARDEDGARLVIRFNLRNPEAERWLRDHSSRLVTHILEEQRDAIRVSLEAGLQRGDNPTRTALAIVGRIDRTSGRRVGGVIGLTAQQAGFVENARTELASNDPALLQNYLTRKLRDRRFGHDRAVAKAIRERTALPVKIQQRMLTSYENRLLKLRGDMIGRTETLTALRASKREAYRQAVESGSVNESHISRRWRSAGDHVVRDSHEALNDMVIKGLARPYVSPVTGAQMLFPGDTSLGAPASEVIGCRCDEEFHIDFLAALG